jgi:hypothetical protein
MSLNEMRLALHTAMSSDDSDEPEEEKALRPKSRLPPDNRGVVQSRSCIVEVDLPGGGAAGAGNKKGTLTFANSVSELKRAGSSRVDGPRRTPPLRAQSCMEG